MVSSVALCAALRLLVTSAAALLVGAVAESVAADCATDSTCKPSASAARAGAGLLQTNAADAVTYPLMEQQAMEEESQPASLLSATMGAATFSKSQAKTAPLVGKVSVLEKDMKTLQTMVQDIEDNVGSDDLEEEESLEPLSAVDTTGDESDLEEPPSAGSSLAENRHASSQHGEAAAAGRGTTARRPRRKSPAAALVEVDQQAVPKASLHQRVKGLEVNIADLQSRTGSLENDVYGESENVGASLVGASLLATEHIQVPRSSDAHLKGRVTKIEKAIYSLKGRVTGLQHEVLG